MSDELFKRIRDAAEKSRLDASIANMDSHAADAMKYMAASAIMKAPKAPEVQNSIKAQFWALLRGRLRFDQGARIPFEYLDFHIEDGKAFVFIVKNKQAMTIEDDYNLFPSDTLITQLRLLIG